VSSFDPSHVDVEHFLDTLGIEHITRATRSEMRFSCPYPSHADGDRTPSCYMNTNTARFFCHGCKERGTAVDMASYVLQITPLEAIRLLKHAYMPGGINPDARNLTEEVRKLWRGDEKVEQPILDERELRAREMDWWSAWEARHADGAFQPANYFFDRGFDPAPLIEWDLGWDNRSQRITIPIHDLDGRLIGFKARATDDRKPKYLVLGDGPGGGPYGFDRYYPSQVVFGAHKARESQWHSPVVVCEGELNAIMIARWAPDVRPVAINGSFFSEFHAKIIRKVATEQGVILWLDYDQAGQNCVWGSENAKGEWNPGIYELLSPYMPVQIVQQYDKDAADMEPFEIKAALEDSRSGLLAALSR
jgi:DNA primase